MEKIFKGRVLISGHVKGEALVSKSGFNPLASYKDACLKDDGIGLCSDQNNTDLYKKPMKGKIICMPQVIGSTSGGLVISTAAQMGYGPLAYLFANHIDSLAASGVILSDIWVGQKIITIDNLGSDFLAYAQTGMSIEIKDDGTVIVNK